ncbi:chemotaxis protein CheW [Maridesulfovibrio bastinii]|uniref:chemotaxis protein CheW n=1 Tax=Maridesulfovibrio bastinii TaxID=47157 RepID=UPI0003F52606|nr:chemotaxis protein CheW [Maridesulfovibrio bastinii]
MNESAGHKNDREILRERAKNLAHRDDLLFEEESRHIGARDYLIITLSGEKFAIETGFIKEIRKVEGLTRIPCTPGWMAGIVSLRGYILQVVDLSLYLGLSRSGKNSADELVIVGNEDIEFCLLVEAVHDVRLIEDSKISRQTEKGFAGAAYCAGITGDRVFVFQTEKLINDPGLEIDEDVVSVPGAVSGNW